jgi:hypothetical protein
MGKPKRKLKHPSKTQIRKWFIYDAENGELINRIDRSHKNKKGKVPGTTCNILGKEYKMLGIKYGKGVGPYFLHRIIWIYHNGAIPRGKEIDHIDHDTLNNRIENLRLVTRSENLKNRKAKSENEFGVFYSNTFKKWEAHISVNRRKVHLGHFATKEEALKVRKAAEKKCGYHENHGKEAKTILSANQIKEKKYIENQTRRLRKRMKTNQFTEETAKRILSFLDHIEKRLNKIDRNVKAYISRVRRVETKLNAMQDLEKKED